MSNRIKCFWLEPSDQVEESLRRYRGHDGTPCLASSVGYHNASVILGRHKSSPGMEPLGRPNHPEYPHTHQSWPTLCPCGYKFQDDDHWQHNVSALYKAVGDYDGQLFTIAAAPVGAMWDAHWYSDNFKGDDGRCVVVKTPGGEWIVDGQAGDGGRWSRSGDPPNLTVTPSIGIGREPGKPWKYHGWLRDGYLVEC